MPTEKVVLLYKFDELSDKAKEKARQWWRDFVFTESHDYEFVYEDAVECGKRMGIEIDTHEVTLMSGMKRQDPIIYFSGFSSQGDGACFEGTYSIAEAAGKQIRDHAPTDKELHRIADMLDLIQAENNYEVTAAMKHRGHYSHSGCMTVDVWRADEDADSKLCDEMARLMRSFANWIYRQLEAEYNYQTADEQVDESIRSNEYTFLENGKRED